MTRFILRPPSFGSTPKRLKRYLQAERVIKIPDERGLLFDFNQDFFMAYPTPDLVVNAPQEYWEMRGVYASTKVTQRQWLSQQGFSVPFTLTRLGQGFGNPIGPSDCEYVVRPLRHSGGVGYRITKYPHDFNSEHEYISQVFPKRWEYRIVLVKGKPVFTLLKKTIRNIDFNMPWNHANGSYFVTCHSYVNNRLRWTNIYDVISNSSVLRQFHIVALDVLLADRRSLGLTYHPYAVCEMNFCPGLTIPSNLEAVRAHVYSS